MHFSIEKMELRKKAQEFQELIRSDHESQDAVAHYTMELMRVRKEINVLIKTHRQGDVEF